MKIFMPVKTKYTAAATRKTTLYDLEPIPTDPCQNINFSVSV